MLFNTRAFWNSFQSWDPQLTECVWIRLKIVWLSHDPFSSAGIGEGYSHSLHALFFSSSKLRRQKHCQPYAAFMESRHSWPTGNFRLSQETFALWGEFITLGPTQKLTQSCTVKKKSTGLLKELCFCERLCALLPSDNGQLILEFLDFFVGV